MGSLRKLGRDRRLVHPLRMVARLLGGAARRQAALMPFLICCLVAAIGAFVIRDLLASNQQAEQGYSESVLGLQQIGQLQSDVQESRRTALYALTGNGSGLQAEYAGDSRAVDGRVSAGLARLGRMARQPEEIALARRLAGDWDAYLDARDRVQSALWAGDIRQAMALDLDGCVPAFERVREDLRQVEHRYDAEVLRRLADSAATSRRSAWRVAGTLGITLLLSCVAVWALQRNRMLSALELARLQMEFVASVSHELRTPLAVLSSAADNLADGVVEGKPSLLTYGAVLQKQSRRMGELIDQILLFASTEDGTHRYVLQSLELTPILHRVAQGAEAQARAAGVAIERHFDEGLPHVVGDASGIALCVQNLLGNAIKYSADSRHVWLRACQTREEVQIAVEDRGMGIESVELARIFEPFYRSPRVQTAQIPGTGLGLSLTKRIAEAMGATLSVESDPSRGSTFTLHLQIARMDNA